jgi:hypothetical protein
MIRLFFLSSGGKFLNVFRVGPDKNRQNGESLYSVNSFYPFLKAHAFIIIEYSGMIIRMQ